MYRGIAAMQIADYGKMNRAVYPLNRCIICQLLSQTFVFQLLTALDQICKLHRWSNSGGLLILTPECFMGAVQCVYLVIS